MLRLGEATERGEVEEINEETPLRRNEKRIGLHG